MTDQAEALRRLVRRREGGAADRADASATRPPHPRPGPGRPRTLLLTSGKGGVGTSNVALNLALALGELGGSVLLVDADLGRANLDMLCGLRPSTDLGDLLSGGAAIPATLAATLVEAPFGVRLLPGSHAIRTPCRGHREAAGQLAAALEGLACSAEFLIIDAGSGPGPGIAPLAAIADEVAVVTTPEPTALADGHAAIAALRRLPGIRLRAVVNQARSTAEAIEVLDRVSSSSREFLGAAVEPLGHVRFDPKVGPAVRARTPFLVAAPRGAASRSVRRLGLAWSSGSVRPVATRRRAAAQDVLRMVAAWCAPRSVPPSHERTTRP